MLAAGFQLAFCIWVIRRARVLERAFGSQMLTQPQQHPSPYSRWDARARPGRSKVSAVTCASLRCLVARKVFDGRREASQHLANIAPALS